jgi:hypothetical protein
VPPRPCTLSPLFLKTLTTPLPTSTHNRQFRFLLAGRFSGSETGDDHPAWGEGSSQRVGEELTVPSPGLLKETCEFLVCWVSFGKNMFQFPSVNFSLILSWMLSFHHLSALIVNCA